MKIQESFDSESNEKQFAHWADMVADKIIKTKLDKNGKEKTNFVCASGITPSGTVHIGNFREIISVDLVARALRARGKTVRFIYSWDDYDVFRKVPKNMPKQEVLAEHLRWPIVLVPDPFGEEESYARHHEVAIERILPAVGVSPEYLYQAKKYRSSEYAEQMKLALSKKAQIQSILDKFRTEDLKGDWWPVSVFSAKTNKDTTTVLAWDGAYGLTYKDDETGETETVDLRNTSVAKLPWRIDWPMRWSVEGTDFEPAGKDHHSDGGSWSTAEHICRDIFGVEAPITFQYDFIRIKGRGGKISSSSGEVIDLYDVLEIYSPEIARYLFAGTRPNTEFAISFDLDVLKIYEDYDKTERVYYGKELIEASHAETAQKMTAKECRIYELSQVIDGKSGILPFMPVQVPFRVMCNALLIKLGNIEAALETLPMVIEARSRGELDQSTDAGRVNYQKLLTRAKCAWKWIEDFAPAEMKFSLRSSTEAIEVSDLERQALIGLRNIAKTIEDFADDKSLQDEIFQMTKELGIDQKAFFGVIYRILVDKTQGPRLAGFLRTLGSQTVLKYLKAY